jgi:hypothetical protein
MANQNRSLRSAARFMKVRCWNSLFTVCVTVCLLFTAHSASAQAPPNRRELVGFVRDSTGAAIPGAAVQIPGAAVSTDARGSFQLWTLDIDTVTISIRRLGFSAVSAQLTARNGQWDTVVVEMDPASQTLAPVTVTGTRGRAGLGLQDFDARRAVGNGLFITRAEVASNSSVRVSDLLRGKHGINLVPVRGGGFGARFTEYRYSRASCAPDIWLDGQWVRGMEVDDLLASDVEAMELYSSMATVPMQFMPHDQSLPCGTIVVWTRAPGT